MALALIRCSIKADQGGTLYARARVSLVSWEGEVMYCCLWFRSVLRVQGPWPKHYGYHLSIIIIASVFVFSGIIIVPFPGRRICGVDYCDEL